MTSMVRRVVACVAVGGLALAITAGSSVAHDDKVPSISDIMKKGHGSKGLLKGIAAEVKAKKWDDASNDAKLLKDFGEALGKNKPEKGSEESWKKLTDEYKKNTAAVAEGVEMKDPEAVTAGLKKIGGSCKGCHSAHKQ